MPIITIKDGYYPIEEVVFVGPDKSGDYPVENESLDDIPHNLNPGKELSFIGNMSDPEVSHDTFQLDYTDVKPELVEQQLRVTGKNLYRKSIQLDREGNGSATVRRPKPMPQNEVVNVYSLTRIRDESMYRRKRENDLPSGRVIGWETKAEFKQRHPDRAERITRRGAKEL